MRNLILCLASFVLVVSCQSRSEILSKPVGETSTKELNSNQGDTASVSRDNSDSKAKTTQVETETKTVKIEADKKTDAPVKREVFSLPTKQEKAQTDRWPNYIPYRAAGAHILITHYDSKKRYAKLPTRGKEEAFQRGHDIIEELKNGEISFEDAVKKYSDDFRTNEVGGNFGIFIRREEFGGLKSIANAYYKLKMGEVSDELAESDFGFHILTRIPLVEYAVFNILIKHKDIKKPSPKDTRTKEQALKIANNVLKMAKRNPDNFGKLAKQYSEEISRDKGGEIGIYSSVAMDPKLTEAFSKLKIGEVTGPIETEAGIHVIRRGTLDRLAALQMLVQYKGAERAKEDLTRTKPEAKKLAEELLAEADAKGDFQWIFTNRTERDNGIFPRIFGMIKAEEMEITPGFYDKIKAAKVGELVFIETQFGFHVVLRVE